MRNVYIIVNGNHLAEALTKGTHDSVHPHENIHYSTQAGKSILNGNFSDEDIAWFEEQDWAYVLGDYLPTGRAEQKVYDHGWTFAKPNKQVPPPSAQSGFVRNIDGQFMLGSDRYRFIGMNKYNIFASGLSLTQMKDFLDACQSAKIGVVRTWLFPDFFQHLRYPLSEINLINNISFESDVTDYSMGDDFIRSNDTARTGDWSIKQVSYHNTYESLVTVRSVTPNTKYVWTFWYKLTHHGGQVSQLPPLIRVRNANDTANIIDAGFLGGTTEWVEKQVVFNSGSNDQVRLVIQNYGGRNDAYYDDFHLGLYDNPVITTSESKMAKIDSLLDLAEQRNIKLIFSLADNNPNFDTKKKLIEWANLVYNAGVGTAFPQIGFYENENVKNVYKQWASVIATRFKNRTGIFSWELGNELRVDRNDPSGQNTTSGANLKILSKPGGWTDQMSTYIKSIDSNHMVAFGDAAHHWQWVSGDNISNGTYYGVSYDLIAQLPNINYVDYHIYPTQGGGEVEVTKKYGQRLGYPNTVNREGFEAQMKDFIDVAKQYGKPSVITEIGYIREAIGSNAIIPLYPRSDNVKYHHSQWFNNDGDGVIWWHGEINDGGSYSYNISGTWNGNTTNLNFDDRPIVDLIKTTVI